MGVSGSWGWGCYGGGTVDWVPESRVFFSFRAPEGYESAKQSYCVDCGR